MLIGLLKSLLARNSGGRKADCDGVLREAEALASAGDVAGAIARCQAALIRGEYNEAVFARLGAYLARSGRDGEARDVLGRVLAVNPENLEARFNLGTLALIEGQAAEAASHLDRALALRPDDPAILTNRGQAAVAQGMIGAAMGYLRRALAVAPGSAQAAEPLFQLLMQQEEYVEAMKLAEDLIALQPDNGRWWRMKAYLLFKRYYEPEEAERCFARAAATQEKQAAFWVERGICARDRGAMQCALDYFEKALALEPGNLLARFHRGLTRLYLADYAAAWPDYEARFADATLQKIQLPGARWEGGEIRQGHLLVMGEQGLGDEIMFASCFGDLPQSGNVTIACTGKLVPIFRASFPRMEVIDKEAANLQRFATCCSIAAGSLPALYRRSPEAFPRRAYLRASAAGRIKAEAFLRTLPPGRRVGISWRGGTEMSRRRLRSLPLEIVAQLAGTQIGTWVSLQYGECATELRNLRDAHGVQLLHPQELLDDYDATAALIEQLDLVVTVCTAVVHLAGALGKEVWVLAPKVPEWRYGIDNRFMPWYRQVEVLRQAESGDWSEPAGEVLRRLSALE